MQKVLRTLLKVGEYFRYSMRGNVLQVVTPGKEKFASRIVCPHGKIGQSRFRDYVYLLSPDEVETHMSHLHWKGERLRPPIKRNSQTPGGSSPWRKGPMLSKSKGGKIA